MRYCLLFFFILISGFISLFAQSANFKPGKVNKYLRKGDYIKAEEVFDQYLKLKPNDQIAQLQFASLLYFDLIKFEKANPFLKNCLKNSTDTLTFGIALLKTEIYCENFNEALSLHEKLYLFYKRKKINSQELFQLKKIIEYNLQHYKPSEIEKFEVGNLGDHINSPYADYVPITNFDEQHVWLTSKRKLDDKEKILDFENTFKEKMFSAKRTPNGFDTLELVHYQFKETKTFQKIKNESFISVSHDGKQLFLFNEGTIWKCINENGKWSKPVKFDEKIMDVKYTNHGSVSSDGKSFYFSSEIDGKGGLDIFQISKTEDGNWSSPKNLEALNTKGNEQGPFICSDGITLYFSSDSLDGFGGYDIYKSIFDGTNWSKPQNLGLPFNSPADDIFYLPKDKNHVGYFSSNRKGTLGNFDIYRFFTYEEHDFDNKNIVNIVNSKDTFLILNAETLDSMIEKLISNKSNHPTFYKINDSIVFNSIQQIITNFKGKSINKVQIEEQLNCQNCAFKMVNFYNILSKKESDKSDVVISDINPKVEIQDKSNVTKSKDSTSEDTSVLVFLKFGLNKNTPEILDLNKLVKELKSNNLKFNIYGYADNRGDEAYNYNLSIKRATILRDLLIKNGIDKERIITVKGFGETKPLVNCEPNCNEDSNSKNRRVEIELIKE
jgi:outer membrane protein OmpA-like peptidoglycan-associated protein